MENEKWTQDKVDKKIKDLLTKRGTKVTILLISILVLNDFSLCILFFDIVRAITRKSI
jgi:hypothetical protein